MGSPRPTFAPEEATMKHRLAFLAALAVVAGIYSFVLAAEDKMTPQQEKMKACNAQAGDKKGEERKAFMSNCLRPAPR
jgi:hypothetical protein